MISVHIEVGEDRRRMATKAVEALGDAFIDECRQAPHLLVHVHVIDHQRPLACTHVDAVRGFLDVVRMYAKTPVVIAGAGHRGTRAAFAHFGYERLPDEYHDVTLMDLHEDDYVEQYSIKQDGSHNVIHRSRCAVESPLTVAIAPLKIHKEVGFSGAVYSWVTGTWIVPARNSAIGKVWAHWPWLEGEGARAHHQSIAHLYKQKPCDVAIVDGILSMQGDGPVEGSAVPMGVLLAGRDAVAVDATAAALAGFDPDEIAYLRHAQDLEAGTCHMSHINVPPMLMAELTLPLHRPFGLEQKLKEANI